MLVENLYLSKLWIFCSDFTYFLISSAILISSRRPLSMKRDAIGRERNRSAHLANHRPRHVIHKYAKPATTCWIFNEAATWWVFIRTVPQFCLLWPLYNSQKTILIRQWYRSSIIDYVDRQYDHALLCFDSESCLQIWCICVMSLAFSKPSCQRMSAVPDRKYLHVIMTLTPRSWCQMIKETFGNIIFLSWCNLIQRSLQNRQLT